MYCELDENICVKKLGIVSRDPRRNVVCGSAERLSDL